VHVVADGSKISLGLFYFETSNVDASWRDYIKNLPPSNAAMIAVESEHSSDHINVKEAQAILIAFQLFS
jgi:hypothetical protein